MSDLNDLLSTKTPQRSQCQFGKWFAALSAADQEAIRAHFGSQTTTTSHIARILIEHRECPVSESSIRSHRRGECRTCGTIK